MLGVINQFYVAAPNKMCRILPGTPKGPPRFTAGPPSYSLAFTFLRDPPSDPTTNE